MRSEVQCTTVEPGYYAPTGSERPEKCPGSGFTCPGGGSKPKPVADTAYVQTEPVDTISFSLELDMSLDAYLESRDTIIEQLAALYQINASWISFKDITSASELRRKLESNGTAQRLRLTVAILVPPFQPPSSDGNDSNLSMAKMWQQHIADANLGSGLYINATLGQDIRMGTSTRQRTLSCEPGYWCSAATIGVQPPL